MIPKATVTGSNIITLLTLEPTFIVNYHVLVEGITLACAEAALVTIELDTLVDSQLMSVSR